MPEQKLAIIDPVGQKAGMDYYDIHLSKGLALNGVEVKGYSNFSMSIENVVIENIFHNHIPNKFLSKIRTVKGYVKALLSLKKTGYKNVLFHLFSYSWLNLFVYALALFLGFRIHAVVHDVESLDESGSDFVQNILLNNLIHKIIVHNNFSLSILKNKTALKNYSKVHVIAHGSFIDLAADKIEKNAAKKELGFQRDATYLLFFGQIKKVKGLDLLLKAFSDISTNPDTYLIIAGRPWNDDFEKYLALIQENNLEERIILDIQYITDEKRSLYFSASDVLILPYRKIFQSGVMMMAMSYGLPVLASDLQPNTEILQHELNGFLFETENIDDLINQLEFILSKDAADLEEIGNNARSTMEKDYSWNKIGQGYKKILIKNL